ncbi:cytochrome b/b6 domain-containing protein [Frigidibacter sp. MR17.14]|uniref:cytochrome b n=1 Tax=Frigidibacter sp. MR17.14 TaxID=3126509 RepID=UPI003013067A
MSTRTGYSALQILLHWLIAALVAFQLIFGESMGHVGRALARGETPDPTDAALASAHYWVGLSILGLVVIRLAVRLRQGTPAPAPAPAWQVKAAKGMHHLFYLLLVLVPLTGLAAVYVTPEAGDIHELAKPAFLILIALHAAAALWHQFALGDGTLMRMLKPR